MIDREKSRGNSPFSFAPRFWHLIQCRFAVTADGPLFATVVGRHSYREELEWH
jgi:hypothetical protein